MPRIVLLSDTHSFEPHYPVPDGDILIHAGDLTRRGTIDELRKVNAFLSELPHKHKIVIAGNHEFCCAKDANKAREALASAIYLQDESIEVMGLKIHGSPWQPQFLYWAFKLPRGEKIAAKWAKIPHNTDILVTHTPPFGVADFIRRLRANVGCRDLLNKVRQIKPKLHVFGHIHYGYGISEYDGVIYANASICTDDYRPINKPLMVDL